MEHSFTQRFGEIGFSDIVGEIGFSEIKFGKIGFGEIKFSEIRFGDIRLGEIKLPGSIHEDTVMDGHRQGKKANAYKYPLTFLK